MTATTTSKSWRNRLVGFGEIAPDQLLANPKNWRVHPKNQQQALASILQEVGFVDPVMVQEGTGVVIDGHARVALALRDGIETIPVQYVDLTDKEADLILATFDPLSAMASRDQELLDDLLAGMVTNQQALQEMLERLATTPPASGGATDPEAIPNIVKTRTKQGDLWHLGNHRLLVGDCTEPETIARLMGEEEADLLLTDPPYGVEYVGKTKDALTIANDNLAERGTRHLVRDALLATRLKPGGVFYIYAPSGNMELAFRLALEDAGYQLRQTLAWVKQDFVLGHSDYHYKHESILYGWADGAGHYFGGDRTQDTVLDDDVDLGTLSKSEIVALVRSLQNQQNTTVVREDRPAASRLHPTTKPVRMLRYLIGNSSQPGEIVLDPFAGSGSTLIAAEQTGRLARLVELDPTYADVLIARWEQFVGRTAEHQP